MANALPEKSFHEVGVESVGEGAPGEDVAHVAASGVSALEDASDVTELFQVLLAWHRESTR